MEALAEARYLDGLVPPSEDGTWGPQPGLNLSIIRTYRKSYVRVNEFCGGVCVHMCVWGVCENFMQGGYFSVSHRKVYWVNVECGSHRGCDVHACVTVYVTCVCRGMLCHACDSMSP